MVSVIIIGAGIGGIATAAQLSRYGFEVTVVEKNQGPGGRCGCIERDGHRFDTGATMFLMPELYTQAFQNLGECLKDHLELQRVDPTYHIHFSEGTDLVLTSDLNAMCKQLEAIEAGSYINFLRYLNEGRNHYRLTIPNLVNRAFRNLPDFLNPSNLLLFLRLNVLAKHYHNIAKYFSDPQLKIAFTFQDLYLGLSPYKAPATFSLIQYSEFVDGVWFPKGGMYRVVEVLVEIAKKWGVRFIYNATVKQIDVEHRKATGVTLTGGNNIQADVLVANADLPYVYRALLPNDEAVRRLECKKFGFSALLFLWGLDKTYPQLGVHNIFFAPNIRQNFSPLFDGRGLPDDPHFYIHAPTRLDASMAPKGQDSLMVAIPSGHINEAAPQDWLNIQQRARRAVLRRLKEFGLDDIEEHIKFEISFTPLDWKKRYNLTKGSTHGLGHNLTQLAYLRPHNRHAYYHNLYFVGASTHPGTGVPNVLVSARLVAERILREVGIPHSSSSDHPDSILKRNPATDLNSTNKNDRGIWTDE